MRPTSDRALSRRSVLAAGGLLVAFSLSARALAQPAGEGGAPKPVAPGLPGSLESTPHLDSWIRIDPAGRITVFTGKAGWTVSTFGTPP